MTSDLDRTLRSAYGVYAVAQLLPGVTVLGFATVGYGSVRRDQPAAGLAVFFLPLVVLTASGWFMRRNWDRPGAWTRGAANAGAVMGLLGGAIVGIALGAAGVPSGLVFLGFVGGVLVASTMVWLPVNWVRGRLLDLDPGALARSQLLVPFALRGHARISFEVGLEGLVVTGRYQGYRRSVIDRVRTADRPFSALGSVKAAVATEPDEVWCPVARYDGSLSVSPGPTLHVAATHGAEPWILPLDDAPRAAEFIRLRRRSGHGFVRRSRRRRRR